MFVRERARGSKPSVTHAKTNHKVMSSSTTSIMRGTRLFRGGLATDLVLLIVFIALAYVFISRRNNGDTVGTLAATKVVGKSGEQNEGDSQHLIDARVKKIPDFRSAACRGKSYGSQEQVSIVATFFDYSFHDLKATLSSILLNTPNDLIREILVIDDGSTLGYIVDKSKAFAKTIEKVRLIRNDRQLWTSGARMRGFRESSSDIVVFVSANVIVSQGWLEPLIAQLKQEPENVAVPHYDSITDPVSYEYKPSIEELVSSISWSLSVRMVPSSDRANQDPSVPLASPALRGNALAVTKKGFTKIGGYDEGFHDGGGADLELSVRAWLCGTKIQICRCSRIGVVNLQDPVKVVSPDNIRRLTELWFSGRKTLVFRNTGIVDAMNQEEQDSLRSRKAAIAELGLTCQSIDWYYQHIVDHVLTPSDKALQFGLLKCKTGRCLSVAEDRRLELGQCKPEHYSGPKAHMLFELTEDGLLVNDGKCLTVYDTAYIMLEDCNQNDAKQKWAHRDYKLINEWSKYCMMHVTDPDKKTDGKRQIVMAQDCKTAPEPQFTTFDFIAL